MSTKRRNLVFISLASLVVLLLWKCCHEEDFSFSNVTVLVGVVSSRENFAQRDAVRRTWSSLGGDAAAVRFLVGDSPCPVPPADRVHPQGCVMHPPFEYGQFRDVSERMLFSTAKGGGEWKVAVGFSAKVVHGPLLLCRLGVLNAVAGTARPTRVSLRESRGGRVMVTASFIHNPDIPDSEFSWKALPSPLQLEVGFEGEITIDVSTINANMTVLSHEITTPALALLETLLPDGSWVPRIGGDNEPKYSPLVGLSYELSDAGSIQCFLNRRCSRLQKWMTEVYNTESLLQEEIRRYGDILLLDVEDVYTNLARKVHRFFEWALVYGGDSWRYLLKTDDDTFVDLKRVVASLAAKPRMPAEELQAPTSRPQSVAAEPHWKLVNESQSQAWNVWSCIKEGVQVPR